MVDLASLERKCTFTGTEGSNPSLSSRMKNKIYLVLLLFLPFFSISHAQSLKENWVPVYLVDQSSKVYINAVGLDKFTGNDIYVWVWEEYKPSIEMEGIDGSIYQSKTYYLINKQKMRYSILQVIYYDDEKNVLKSYSYDHNEDNPDFKYNLPIFKGTMIDAVLKKCIEFGNQAGN